MQEDFEVESKELEVGGKFLYLSCLLWDCWKVHNIITILLQNNRHPLLIEVSPLDRTWEILGC